MSVRRHRHIDTGISTCPEDGTEFEELIHRADEAIYAAKTAWRNRVEAA